MPPKSRIARVGGLRLHYLEWGTPGAPTIVLLHSLRGFAYGFDVFARALADRYHVFALDQRGRGDSEWAPDGDYTRPAYVADVRGWIDDLGLDRFVLVGHSMGGLNAFHFAAENPERVAALVSIDMGPELDPAGIERIVKELQTTPPAFASRDDAVAFLRTRHPADDAEALAVRARWMLREATEGGVEWRLDPAIFNPALPIDPAEVHWAAWRAVSCPALIVRGAESDLLTRDTCDRMVSAVPTSRWVDVPGAGHMVHEDEPEAFRATVAAFLDTLGSP